jgi:two-component system nitrate/nitrite response regulator NarL
MAATASSSARVLVVDDDDGCRALVRTLLERIGCTTEEAATGTAALEIAETFRPTLVVLDVNIPGVTGYEVCHELRERFGPALGVIFLSGARIEALDRVAGLLIGADDYVVKPFDPDELVARIRAQLRKRERRSGGRAEPAAGALTSREREVLDLLARGLDQNQIAKELVISPKTVATHIQHVLPKLGVHSRAQAVAVARRAAAREDVEAHGASVVRAGSTRPERRRRMRRASGPSTPVVLPPPPH